MYSGIRFGTVYGDVWWKGGMCGCDGQFEMGFRSWNGYFESTDLFGSIFFRLSPLLHPVGVISIILLCVRLSWDEHRSNSISGDLANISG